jgi:hypothetical protein
MFFLSPGDHSNVLAGAFSPNFTSIAQFFGNFNDSFVIKIYAHFAVL